MSPPATTVVYNEHGPPEAVVKIVEFPPVEIKENDVCVRMLAAPINPSDINRIEGTYSVRPPVPAVGGYEGVEEIHSVGPAVKGFSPGDLVIPSPPTSGTWQTYVVKEQNLWHKVNKSTPLEYAAKITVNPLTAFRMLKDFVDLKSGDSIVQNGATSIVGQCLIQLDTGNYDRCVLSRVCSLLVIIAECASLIIPIAVFFGCFSRSDAVLSTVLVLPVIFLLLFFCERNCCCCRAWLWVN